MHRLQRRSKRDRNPYESFGGVAMKSQKPSEQTYEDFLKRYFDSLLFDKMADFRDK